ncbi:MAG: hypothetical protein VXV87_05765, partial [Pseudomonadota bacterium]|nr:hypothetical protein [Pseudomonadota bacterium]
RGSSLGFSRGFSRRLFSRSFSPGFSRGFSPVFVHGFFDQRLRGSFKRPPPMAGWQVFPWRETLPVSDDTVSDNTTPESVSVHATAAYGS